MEKDTAEIEVVTPGAKLRARGTDVVSVILAIAVSLSGYALWEHKAEAKADAAIVASTLAKSTADQLEALRAVTNAQAELTYLMSLSPEQRMKLGLEMPDSLRNRLRGR